MTDYSLTWANGTNPTNFAGKRALDKIETNAALMWQTKTNPQDTSTRNNAWVVGSGYTAPTGTRVANTTYTYTGSVPRLIIVSIYLESASAVLAAGGAPTCNIQVRDPTDGALVTLCNGSLAAGALLTGTRGDYLTLYGIVNPGANAQYRVNTNAPTRSTARIDYWFEFDFSSKHANVTYSTGQLVTSLNTMNRYAGGVNGITSATVATARTTLNTTLGSTINIGDELVFLSPCITGTTVGTITGQLKNNGDSVTSIIQNGTNMGNAYTKSMTFPVNPDGGYQINVPSGASHDADSCYVVAPRATGITFTTNEFGTSTGNKFRNLDTNASGGINLTKPFTRSNQGSGTGNIVNGSTFAFYALEVTLPQATGTASIVRATGTNSTTTEANINGGLLAAATLAVNNMMFGILAPGQTLSFTTANGATINKRWLWNVAS